MDTITLRGSHLVNLYRYAHDRHYRLKFGEAQGYSAEFAARHDALMQKIIDQPDQPVKIVMGCDDLCLKPPCPRKSEDCEAVSRLAKDRAVAQAFGVQVEVTYSAERLLNQLRRVPSDQVPE